MIGFSEVTLTEQALADYADTLAYLGAAIRLYRDTFRRLGLLGGQGQGKGQDGDGQQPTGKAGERFKVACGCQPPRSFWIRAKQYTPGPISCGVCGQDFQPRTVHPASQARTAHDRSWGVHVSRADGPLPPSRPAAPSYVRPTPRGRGRRPPRSQTRPPR